MKGKHLEGKRNRRIDHLIHTLVGKAVPHLIARDRRQEFGFEGPDLEMKRRLEIQALAHKIESDQITPIETSN